MGRAPPAVRGERTPSAGWRRDEDPFICSGSASRWSCKPRDHLGATGPSLIDAVGVARGEGAPRRPETATTATPATTAETATPRSGAATGDGPRGAIAACLPPARRGSVEIRRICVEVVVRGGIALARRAAGWPGRL